MSNTNQTPNSENNKETFKRIEETQDTGKIINNAPKPEKQDKYYIASGFFNPAQVATVDKIEDTLDRLQVSYFSPRQESVPFFKESDSEIKSMMTKMIFNNNLDCMNSCNKFIVNMQDNDQGTLFELGYIAGSRYFEDLGKFSSDVKIMNDSYGLEKLLYDNFRSNPSSNMNFDIMKLFSHTHDAEYLEEVLTKVGIVDHWNIPTISIDDRHPVNCFLIGYFYALNSPIITYSRKGFGSNVMLVHSAYHCENESQLESLLKDIKDKNVTESHLFLKKQDFNKQID